MNPSDVVDRSAINERAYLHWLQRGCPNGSPEYDWFEAEQELLREHVASAAAPAASEAVTPSVASEPASAQEKPAAKRSRARRGKIESNAPPAAAASATARRRGPASSTKPVVNNKRRAVG
jgi:hypothetical protein